MTFRAIEVELRLEWIGKNYFEFNKAAMIKYQRRLAAHVSI
jgi:hypothetical protein